LVPPPKVQAFLVKIFLNTFRAKCILAFTDLPQRAPFLGQFKGSPSLTYMRIALFVFFGFFKNVAINGSLDEILTFFGDLIEDKFT